MPMAKTDTVTINATVANGTGSAPTAQAHPGDTVVWIVGGAVKPDDEVMIGEFRENGTKKSPMKKSDSDRKRKGPGRIEDTVKEDAKTNVDYEYDITVKSSTGVTTAAADPIIQIKP